METKPEPAEGHKPGEITCLLQAVGEGDAEAANQLCSQLYRELHQLASFHMAHEAPGQTLQPTALVHEAWLRLVGNGKLCCPDRAYFFAAAGEAMRRILVENARRKKRLKRGGDLERVALEDVNLPVSLPDEDVLALDEALTLLAKTEPRAAEFVKLHIFVGLSQQEAARELGISIATAQRDWAFCRAWLFRQIQQLRNGSG